MNLISNIFSGNSASSNGLVLDIFNSFGIINLQNNSFSNNTVQNSIQSSGSVIFLSDPGNISILNSTFENNYGIFGTCIYYSETSNLSLIAI